MRAVLRGGLVDKSALTDDYLDELLAVGVPCLVAARSRYPRAAVPIHIVYCDKDWSRPSDRHANEKLLPHADFVYLPNVGHFASLERPTAIAALLVQRSKRKASRTELFAASASPYPLLV